VARDPVESGFGVRGFQRESCIVERIAKSRVDVAVWGPERSGIQVGSLGESAPRTRGFEKSYFSLTRFPDREIPRLTVDHRSIGVRV
jgi:hypothetical protein